MPVTVNIPTKLQKELDDHFDLMKDQGKDEVYASKIAWDIARKNGWKENEAGEWIKEDIEGLSFVRKDNNLYCIKEGKVSELSMPIMGEEIKHNSLEEQMARVGVIEMNILNGREIDEATADPRLGVEIQNSYKDLESFVVYEYKDYLYLASIIVKDDARNKGVGSMAMRDLIRYAEEEGKDILAFDTKLNKEGFGRSFFQRLGFERAQKADLKSSEKANIVYKAKG